MQMQRGIPELVTATMAMVPIRIAMELLIIM